MKQRKNRESTVAHYSVTILLTVCFLAVVILLNVLFTQLADAFDWRVDMSGEQIYGVSDTSFTLLREQVDAYQAEKNQAISFRIIFCATEESVQNNSLGYYVLNLAKNYAQELPFVTVSFLDMVTDPAKANGFLSATVTELTGANVILELCDSATGERLVVGEDTGYRIDNFQNLFSYDANGNYVGFGGEYRFTYTMLSLISGGPLAVFTTGNGESVSSTGGNGLRNLIADSGFNVQVLDLEDNAIPAEAKLLVINNPTKDLIPAEIEKLQAFSNAGGHLMVFMDPQVYELSNLSAALSAYGVTFTEVPGYLIDQASSLAASSGLRICGTLPSESYDGELAKGTALTAGLRADTGRPAVFPNACAITPTSEVGEKGKVGTTERYLSAMFTTTASATNPGATEESELYGQKQIMTITEDKATGGKTLVCASPEFVINAYILNSSYANRTVITSVLTDMEEGLAADARISVRLFDDQSLQIASDAADNWTAFLVIFFPVAVLAIGTVVYVRRRHL